MQTSTTQRIYVACLAAYNNGQHHGSWLDLGDYQDLAGLQAAVAGVLATSPEQGAEEFAIHDHEGFCGLEIGESDLAGAWAAHEALQASERDDVVTAAAITAFGAEWQDYLVGYCGAYDRRGEYAEGLLGNVCYDLATLGQLAQYVDWARFERDMELGGDIVVVYAAGQHHIFNRHC